MNDINKKQEIDSLRFFVALLKDAFPYGEEKLLAFHAAKKLDCSERQVRNWLKLKHQPRLEFAMKILGLVGPERSYELAIDCFGDELGAYLVAGLKQYFFVGENQKNSAIHTAGVY